MILNRTIFSHVLSELLLSRINYESRVKKTPTKKMLQGHNLGPQLIFYSIRLFKIGKLVFFHESIYNITKKNTCLYFRKPSYSRITFDHQNLFR